MKTFKKSLAIILSLVTIFCIASVGANAGGDMFGDFGVTWNGEDEEFYLIDIENVTEAELVIPETINDWPVVGFKFNEHDVFETVETLVLPKTFSDSWTEFPLSNTFPSLKEIIVNENNPYFASVDGVLYDKDLTYLCAYPCNKEDVTFETPAETLAISHRAFEGCKNLKTLVLGEGIYDIFTDYYGSEPCSMFSSVENFAVNENNPYFASVDGVLYTSDKKTLVKYPDANTDTDFSVPEDTETIGKYSFGYCQNLKNLYLSSTVKNIDEYAFAYSSLGYIDFSTCDLEYIGENILTDTPIYESDNNWDSGLFYYNNYLLEASYDNGASIKIRPGTTYIAASVFDKNDYIYLLSIPSSMETINSLAISVRVTNICYGDFEENWDNIYIGRYNSYNLFNLNKNIDFEDTAVFHYECENADSRNSDVCSPSFLTRIISFFKILFNLF